MNFSLALEQLKDGRLIRRRSSGDRRCYRMYHHPTEGRSWIRYGDWPHQNDFTGFSNADILANDWAIVQGN